MKIMQINSVCGIGSTGKITTDLYKVMKAQGHECIICYGRGTAPKGFATYRIGTDTDVYKHVLYTRITDKTAFASRKATEEFLHMAKEYDPDIIHLHNLHGYYLNLELLFEYLKDTGKPVIWSLYDCWSFTGHCSHFDYVGCDKWKSGCYKCIQKKEYPASLLFDHSELNYQKKKAIITSYPNLTIVPPTRWLADLVKQSYLREFKSLIIPSGIDLDAFHPRESTLRAKYALEEKYVVLGVSNGFDNYKGTRYFIELANRLPEKYKVVLVGVNDENKHNFPNNILALPRTNSCVELAEFYSMADVFVNPTLQETQGLTNIEALACGTGVVTFDSGGCPESIDETCGIVVKREDLEGLLQAVIKACEVPFDSNACLQRAARYDKSKLYLNYIELYEDSIIHETV